MKKDKYEQACRQKLLRLKQSYKLQRYQDLLIHDEYTYPPVQKDVQQLLVSQFGFSLLDQFIRNYNEERFDKKNKLPLPIIFAIIHHQLKIGKYQNLVKIILHHVDRTTVSKYYIITYIVAKIYQRFQQYRKSVFYLENVLKEQPFFYQAIYDLCYHYAFRLQRQEQACTLLERHISRSQTSHQLIVPLYLYICSKFKMRSTKDVVKLLHNKSMSIASYFNLGVFLRQNEQLEKAQEIFVQIIAKLTKAKNEKSLFSIKDEKLLMLSKVNLFILLQMRKSTNNSFKDCLDEETLQRLTQYSLKQAFTEFPKNQQKSQLKVLLSNRQQKVNQKVYKKQNTQNLQGIDLQSKQKLRDFNKQFTNIRQYNTKKLKYLLQKQKQISHFFKNLIIKKDVTSQKYSIQYKIKDKPFKFPNQSIVSKVKAIPDQYEVFQKEFQSKKKLHEFKYSNVELQSMLSQILTNFEDCLFSHKKGKGINTIDKQNVKVKPKMSIRKQNVPVSKYSSTIDVSTLQTSQKKLQNERKLFKTPKNKGNLKSQRNNYCFRIKQTNKQSKQIREQMQLNDSKRHFIFSQINSPQKEEHKRQTKLFPQQNIKDKGQLLLKAQSSSQNQKQQQKKQENSTVHLQADKFEEIRLDKQIKKEVYQKKPVLEDQQASQQALASQTNCIELSKKELKNEQTHKQQSQRSLQFCDDKEITNTDKQIQLQKDQQKLQENQGQFEHFSNKIINQQYQKKQKVIFEQDSIDEHSQQEQKQQLEQKQILQPIKNNDQTLNKQVINSSLVAQPPFKQNVNEEVKVEKKENKTPPQQQKNYDPFASTFQLTGFNKSSLSKFRQIKSDKNQLNKKSIFPNVQSKQLEKEAEKLSTQFEEQLKKAQYLQKQQQYDKAYQLYTRIYKQFKKQTQKQIVLIKIGSLFQKRQKYSQAQKTYLKCTKFNNVDAFLKLGALLINNGRISSGVQNIEKANCIKRNDLQIQNRLVYGYSLRQETMEKALTLAQMILKKQPQSLQTLIITANILQKQGKIKEAIEIVTAIDKFKQAEYIKHYLGILYLQDSNLTQAFNYFKAALAIKPDFIPSLIEVATIISQISPKQSISILQKVLQVEPQNRKVLARLGKIYQSIENDFENAMVAYQTALQTQQNYQSYIKIGDCLAKQQSYIQALINYKQALNLRKTHQAYAKVACMYEKKYQLVKAIENYELALEIICTQKEGSMNSIKRKEYLVFLGTLNIRIGNYDASIKFFEEIQDHIDSIDLLKLLAEAYFGKKQYSMALQRFQKANELANGESIQILQKIAICFDKLEEYMASKPIYEKILEKDHNNIRCMNNLANILLIIGETNQSFYLFENMLQKAPKNLQKRIKVADIYAQVGDWSKVEFHLLQCLKIKDNDQRVIERLINLYKQKRDMKMANKYQKKLAIMKNLRKNQQKKVPA